MHGFITTSSIIALVCSAFACGHVADQNEAPIIIDVQLEPVDPTVLDTITATVEASDPEEDAISLAYVWYVNDTAVDGATGSSLDSTYFLRGDTVYVSVTASDAELTSEPATSATLTVANLAPSAPVVRIEPANVFAGGSMACLIETESEDLDGDTITYTGSWTVDAAPYPNPETAAFEGDTIPADVTKPNEQWRCTVTADDGFGGTAEATSDPVSVRCLTGGSVQFEVNGQGSNGSIQTWTVPANVCTITIEAMGARGGAGTNTRGARMRGSFNVVEGETFRILVGQQGINSLSQLYGGGGTFVVDANNQPLIVAGGGGSCFSNCPPDAETVGRIQTSGGTAGGVLRANNGQGGNALNTTSGGGGGFFGNGANITGGRSFMNGAQGGSGESQGGYGGGGARNGSYGQGGGGGYSGGSCGDGLNSWVGCGGGGSFNAGFDQDNASGLNNGPGRVVISW